MSKVPPKYDDLGKEARDVFGKGYGKVLIYYSIVLVDQLLHDSSFYILQTRTFQQLIVHFTVIYDQLQNLVIYSLEFDYSLL